MHTQTHTHMHTHIQTCARTYVHAHTHAYACIHTHTYTHTHTHMHKSSALGGHKVYFCVVQQNQDFYCILITQKKCFQSFSLKKTLTVLFFFKALQPFVKIAVLMLNCCLFFCRCQQLSASVCAQTLCVLMTERLPSSNSLHTIAVKGFLVVVTNLCAFWWLTLKFLQALLLFATLLDLNFKTKYKKRKKKKRKHTHTLT